VLEIVLLVFRQPYATGIGDVEIVDVHLELFEDGLDLRSDL
jgi:hypothetical protein